MIRTHPVLTYSGSWASWVREGQCAWDCGVEEFTVSGPNIKYVFKSCKLVRILIMVLRGLVGLVSHSATIWSLILSSGYCLCGVLHVHSISAWVSSRFSGSPPPPKNTQIGGFSVPNCPKVPICVPPCT